MKTRLIYNDEMQVAQLASANKMRSWVKKDGRTQQEIAALLKIKPAYMSDLLVGRRNWTEALALKLEKALNNGVKR